MNRKKLLTSGTAVVAAAGVLLGGTFAWQSISQTALNEISGTVNPGGRLHDDFHEITAELKKTAAAGETITMTYDKDVYVENFTEYAKNGVQVYARVRLDEYMEMGGVSLVDGAEKDDKTTWSTYKFNEDSDFRDYWEMKFGGQTIYMPTFNKNKDSLEADINGTSEDDFKSYVDYSEKDVDGNYNPQTSYAVYDKDDEESGKEIDEIAKQEMLYLSTIIAGGEDALDEDWDTENYGDWRDHIAVEKETHTPQATIDGGVVSMADYMKWLNDENDAFDGKGNFWVYDTDGWAYWAMPIDPETATGLLLDQISRTSAIINQDWYYAINVTAQFVTYDDLGTFSKDDDGIITEGTGFYDPANGATAPSDNALTLLEKIGVVTENAANGGISGGGDNAETPDNGDNTPSNPDEDKDNTAGDNGDNTPTDPDGSGDNSAESVALGLPAITVAVEGEDVPKNTFRYTLERKTEGAPMPEDAESSKMTVSRAGKGTIDLGSLTFTKAGTYEYTLSDASTASDGWTYDDAVYTITCTVTENDGSLSAEYALKKGGETASKITFTNTYEEVESETVTYTTYVVWNHGSNADTYWPKQVVVDLRANGQMVQQLAVFGKDGYNGDPWYCTWIVPVYDEDGVKITYTMGPYDVDGYDVTVSELDTSDNSFTITFTYTGDEA